jgi:GMP synthase-like glutamine amidotransferase
MLAERLFTLPARIAYNPGWQRTVVPLYNRDPQDSGRLPVDWADRKEVTVHAHFFQHVPFEGLGSIAAWLEDRGATITGTRFFEEAAAPPKIDDIDLLVVMGGPMSTNDERLYPWLLTEKRFIADAIEKGTAVLGVCLGAQLIASALGARVYPNREREIGWFPVHPPVSPEKTREPAFPIFAFPEECTVFHWHGETFDLPIGALHLAGSRACQNQAFQCGPKVIGLQFHLEITPEGVRDLVEGNPGELTAGEYVQSAEAILAAPAAAYEGINRLMAGVLTFLAGA